ncbi:glycosyltransferase [Microcella pacifica]|uniref:D-inositol 3-phosphate glycosyltransferase n=1 Tax=Microcella pacifica TaxID=2591847 RepID=A0A9E5MFN1_9MICO|nr:glycosyltransferase [Microcella pacifica]NHF63902.1 glycosyltransferase [Microcella pacifica]
MRIAVTTGLLPVPPTYFVVQHALELAAVHDFAVFARAARVGDPDVGIAIDSVVPESAGSWPWRMRLAVLAGREHARRIRSWGPDLVHQQFATWSHGAVSAAAPLVTTLHGYDVVAAESRARTPLAAFHRRSIRRTIERSDRVLPVSRYLADRAIAAGFPSERVQVHYQGIDTDWFTPGEGPTDDRDAPALVFVGRWSRAKGLHELLDASVALQGRTPHRLRVVGAGPLESAVRSAAAAHPHIEVLGSLPRAGVRQALRGARALVLPTQLDRGWREAAGLVLLEAQACGVPAITYASGGAPEMVREGETGLVVPERDTAALGDALHSLLTLPSTEHRAMGVRAREWVVAERSLAASAAQLDAHYREVAA